MNSTTIFALLARELGVTQETPYFKNPSKPGNIFWFYDPCHLLKLVRNHLIDSGFRLPADPSILVGIKELEKLLNDRGDHDRLSILHKLNIDKHLKGPFINSAMQYHGFLNYEKLFWLIAKLLEIASPSLCMALRLKSKIDNVYTLLLNCCPIVPLQLWP